MEELEQIPARVIRSATIGFGMINIPVRIMTATQERGIAFNMLHTKDGARLKQPWICSEEEVEVPPDERVRGYRYNQDRYVTISDEEIARARPERTSIIEIESFVKEGEIDIRYFEKPYFLQPDRGAAKAYTLLREALRRSRLVGISTYVAYSRGYIGVIKPFNETLILEQVRFFSELRAPNINLPQVEISDQELKLAQRFIGSLRGPFDPSAYKDVYTEELQRIIDAKISGKEPEIIGEAPSPTRTVDLMEALRASIEEVKTKKASKNPN